MMLSKFAYKLYAVKISWLRKLILHLAAKFEGGQMWSGTLRGIFSDYHNIEIGMYSYGGCFDIERIAAFTKIGRYCSFARGVCIFNGNHSLHLKSTHPFFYNPEFGYVKEEKILRGKLTIGNDVWVGRNVIIVSSVNSIGDGAVIGAGAVVTKDVPDFAIVAGNPAKIIRYRFSKPTIDKIKTSAWWDKNIDELKENLEDFLSPIEEENEQET
jgi:virginiamycin A acetyltransferase